MSYELWRVSMRSWSGTGRRLLLAFGSLFLVLSAGSVVTLAGHRDIRKGLDTTREKGESVRLALELASAVLGLVNDDGAGIEGVELALDDRLQGVEAEVRALRDGRGRLVIGGVAYVFGPDSTLVIPPGMDHQIFCEPDAPMETIAAFSATPVQTDLPDDTPIALPWAT